MSVNESDLPQFHAGPETPIGQITRPNGIPIASKKQASGLMKRLMALAKPATAKSKGKMSKFRSGRTGRRGIESDNKVRMTHKQKFW